MKNKSLGFTLIELLVVVAILGVLAVGVVALLNPAEKTNKAKDVANKNTASEIIGAYELYAMESTTPIVAGTYSGTTLATQLQTLVTSGHLKASILQSPLVTETNTSVVLTTSGVSNIGFRVFSTEYKTDACEQDISPANNTACGKTTDEENPVCTGSGTGTCIYLAY